MFFAKAAFEFDIRVFAYEVGRKWGICVNIIFVGFFGFCVVKVIGFIDKMINYFFFNASFKEKSFEVIEIGNIVVFLCFLFVFGIIGVIIYVDNGFNVMGFVEIVLEIFG